MSDTKPSNPKEIIGSKKLSMSLVPWTLMVCAARAFLEGALKYGRFNWRIAGVSASTYLDAIKRHLAKWENGQNCDPKTRVHHLDNAIACLAIIRDAELYGMLTDDRPPCPDPDRMAELIDADGALIAHLKYEFRDHASKQYTIADTPRVVLDSAVLDQRPEWARDYNPPLSPKEVPAGTAEERFSERTAEPWPSAIHGRDALDDQSRFAAEREALRVNAEIDIVAELPARRPRREPGHVPFVP